jgi:hypothetical protein
VSVAKGIASDNGKDGKGGRFNLFVSVKHNVVVMKHNIVVTVMFDFGLAERVE